MATLAGTALDDELHDRLSGRNLDALSGKAIQVCTVDSAGRPHPAMLSYLEMIAKDPQNIRLAIRADSLTTRNLRDNGKLTIMIVDEGLAVYIKGVATLIPGGLSRAPHLAKWNFVIQEVLYDRSDPDREGESCITGGITYTMPKLSAARREWKELLEELAK